MLLTIGMVVVAGGIAGGIVLAFRGGSTAGLSPAAYLARGSAVCRGYARQLDHIPPPADLGSPAAVSAAVGQAFPVLRKQAAAVRAIKPPRELERSVRRYFELSDRSLALLDAALAAARRNDRAVMGPKLGAWFEASAAAQAASRKLGFRC
jgi:hypothetical protein